MFLIKFVNYKGVRFPCAQCEYTATTAGNLKKHIENKHEGVRYSCYQCEYSATTACYYLIVLTKV